MQCSGGDCPAWLPLVFAAFPVFFVGMWVGVCHLLGALGGWRRLAERYRVTDYMPSGEEITWQSGSMRGKTMPVRYNNVINLTVAPEGLGLDMVFLFRQGHPKLHIPWGDIEISEATSWGRQIARLKIADTGVWLTLASGRAVKAVLEAHANFRGVRR